MAFQMGHYQCVLLLLQAGAMVDTPGINGQTPLYSGCGIGHLKCVVMLVEHGADVNKCRSGGETSLMACAEYDRFLVCHIFLQMEPMLTI